MTIRSQKDFIAGLIFFVVGLGFAYASLQYRLGTAARMGPGYFPLMLGGLLAILGAGVIIGATGGQADESGRIGRFNMRSLAAVVVSAVLFALLIETAGLLVTVALTTFVASYASPEARLRIAVVNVFIQVLIAVGVFHYLLGLQMPLLPAVLIH